MQPSFSRRACGSAFAIAALALATLSGLTTQARALTDQEAAAVVDLIERLHPELGPLAYDEEEAELWFARDAVRERLIARAGFTRQSWRAAFDATIRAYIATVPEDTLDALFAQMRQRLEHAPRMTAEQRASAGSFVAEERARLDELRASGRPDAEVVRPHLVRLARLMPGPKVGAATDH